jgi:hypothetical protein
MRDLDWSDVEADADRMRTEIEDREYAEYAAAHSEEIFRENMTAWVETLCEGHESLRGDMMGAEDFCDGTCRPLRERDESAYLEYLEGLLPDD